MPPKFFRPLKALPSFKMRILLPVLLLLVSIFHTWLLASWWPASLLSITPSSNNLLSLGVLNGLSSYVVASGCLIAFSLFRTKRRGAAGGVVALLVMGVVAYLKLPLVQVFKPSLVSVGALGGLAVAILSYRFVYSRGETDEYKFPRISFLGAFLLAYNALLLIAPSNVVFPTGFAGDVSWANDTLILRHEDSVAIHHNLIFLIIRSVLNLILGNSLLANSVVTTVMVSIGLAFVCVGIQLAVGAGAALVALSLMITERWVMVTSYAANLPASLPMTAGLLFYITMRIGCDPSQRTRGWHWRTFTLLVFATLLSMYTYAAVRMPFVFSVGCIALLYAVRSQGTYVKRVRGASLWVVAPVVCGVLIMVLGPYRGSFSGLQHDLFVTWPQDLVLSHPGPEGLKHYELVKNFDNPLWQQIARPTDGTNRSVIWRKTPLEFITDFHRHLSEVADNFPILFFLQPLPFLLVLMGACSLPLMSPNLRFVFSVSLVSSALWLSTFLLVPDPTAFRRAVAFPPLFAAVASLAFVPFLHSRLGRWMAVVIVSTVVVTRLPYELAFANRSEARMRMFTVCSTAPAHRALLTSELMAAKSQEQVSILPNGINGGREGMCLDTAVASREWLRLLPHSRLLSAELERQVTELEQLPGGSVLAVYCNPESRRAEQVNALCSKTDVKFRSLGEIPNSYDGGYWVVLQKN